MNASLFRGKRIETPKTVRQRWHMRRIVGMAGILAALPFFIWLPLAWVDIAPSIIDVLGLSGFRILTCVTIAGLVLGAIGFHNS